MQYLFYTGKEPVVNIIYERVIYENKETTCFASIFMTLCVCIYVIINPVLFGNLKYLYRTITSYLLQLLSS